ncbi:MAG: choline-sulfatase [Candidatus Paceibacteria bacterium]|jgi:choline-sulfatase
MGYGAQMDRRFWIAGGVLLLIESCGGSAPGAGATGGTVAGPRSALLVTIDTLRADRLGCYGYGGARTPNMDDLAASGVRFEQASAAAPLTFPSHTSIMTGTIPAFHGARDNASHRALPELVTLAEVLQAEGYQTGAFTAAFVLDAIYGLDQGFDVYGDTPQRQQRTAGEFEERPAWQVNEEACAWLDEIEEDKPFFLWVHYFEPHLPYPPAAQLPPGFEGRPYDAEIHEADRQLGRLLDYLDQKGRRDETLVVLTSDHGESLGEHGENTHGFFAYESVMRVPLLFSHSSLTAGRVAETRGSSIRIMGTVLEALKVSVPEHHVIGESLLPLLRGEAPVDEPIYFESMNPRLGYGWAPIHGVYADGMKYIRVPRPELYALDSDPDELKNLYESDPESARRLDSMLELILSTKTSERRLSASKRTMSAIEREKLAALGYIGTASDTQPELTLADPKDGIQRIVLENEVRDLMARGALQEAERGLTQLLREDPRNPIFNGQFGLLLMMQQRHRDALPYIRESIRGGQTTATNYCNLGTCLHWTKDDAGAKQALEDALIQNPKHLLSYFWLGTINTSLGEKEAASACYEKMLELWDGGEGPMTQQMRGLIADLKK